MASEYGVDAERLQPFVERVVFEELFEVCMEVITTTMATSCIERDRQFRRSTRRMASCSTWQLGIDPAYLDDSAGDHVGADASVESRSEIPFAGAIAVFECLAFLHTPRDLLACIQQGLQAICDLAHAAYTRNRRKKNAAKRMERQRRPVSPASGTRGEPEADGGDADGEGEHADADGHDDDGADDASDDDKLTFEGRRDPTTVSADVLFPILIW